MQLSPRAPSARPEKLDATWYSTGIGGGDTMHIDTLEVVLVGRPSGRAGLQPGLGLAHQEGLSGVPGFGKFAKTASY